MSGTFVHFPRCYEVDDYFFAWLARFIRYEIVTHLDQYPYKLGLQTFIADLEKFGWHEYAQTVIDVGRYCGSVKSYPEFVDCLDRVRDLLVSLGPQVPEAWADKLKVSPGDHVVIPPGFPVSKLLYWLDCLRQAVQDYKPFIGVHSFSPSPG